MADDKEAAEALIAETQKKIKDAFAVFDHEGNSTVDVREIGTIIRSLGCCPSEEELHEMLAEVEEEEPTGYIQFDKFLPMMTKVLIERKYRPQSEEIILRAFEAMEFFSQPQSGQLTAPDRHQPPQAHSQRGEEA
ncbi:dynein regulatory complex protein 8 isoform X2 [Amblyraja radiata]|uniref:dynein regulatory complex protein 8 isoform X2 n=1 Tax=Amblyraja radiata TaxID=386614 RepID=UPI001401BC77|nr:dynein regulatory complex protein 8 isoform X2 [Amblyraja radiata]